MISTGGLNSGFMLVEKFEIATTGFKACDVALIFFRIVVGL